ncbi:MAG: zinc-binding dehydrogenase, partial [Myxococcota bacterium]
GFASGDIPKVPLNLALLKGCDIVGVFWGSFAAREPAEMKRQAGELLRLHAEGKLQNHIHERYPLERAVDALKDILARKVRGKAIITPGLTG